MSQTAHIQHLDAARFDNANGQTQAVDELRAIQQVMQNAINDGKVVKDQLNQQIICAIAEFSACKEMIENIDCNEMAKQILCVHKPFCEEDQVVQQLSAVGNNLQKNIAKIEKSTENAFNHLIDIDNSYSVEKKSVAALQKIHEHNLEELHINNLNVQVVLIEAAIAKTYATQFASEALRSISDVINSSREAASYFLKLSNFLHSEYMKISDAEKSYKTFWDFKDGILRCSDDQIPKEFLEYLDNNGRDQRDEKDGKRMIYIEDFQRFGRLLINQIERVRLSNSTQINNLEVDSFSNSAKLSSSNAIIQSIISAVDSKGQQQMQMATNLSSDLKNFLDTILNTLTNLIGALNR